MFLSLWSVWFWGKFCTAGQEAQGAWGNGVVVHLTGISYHFMGVGWVNCGFLSVMFVQLNVLLGYWEFRPKFVNDALGKIFTYFPILQMSWICAKQFSTFSSLILFYELDNLKYCCSDSIKLPWYLCIVSIHNGLITIHDLPLIFTYKTIDWRIIILSELGKMVSS